MIWDHLRIIWANSEAILDLLVPFSSHLGPFGSHFLPSQLFEKIWFGPYGSHFRPLISPLGHFVSYLRPFWSQMALKWTDLNVLTLIFALRKLYFMKGIVDAGRRAAAKFLDTFFGSYICSKFFKAIIQIFQQALLFKVGLGPVKLSLF
jgi:hypothetical protein